MPVFAAMILILMLGFKWVISIIEFAILIKKFWIWKKDFLTRKIFPSRWSQKEISTQKERKIECFFRISILKYFVFFIRKDKSLQVQLANIRPVRKALIHEWPGSLPKFYREAAKALSIDKGCILFISKDKIDLFCRMRSNEKGFLIKTNTSKN